MANAVGNVPHHARRRRTSPDLEAATARSRRSSTSGTTRQVVVLHRRSPRSAAGYCGPAHDVRRRSGRRARYVTCRPAWQARRADRRTSSLWGRRRSGRDRSPADAGARRPSDAAGTAARRSHVRLVVLLLLSPWIIGFLAFTAIPMGLSLYCSFTHYDLTSARTGSGWATTGSCSGSAAPRPVLLAGDPEHDLDHRLRRPARILFAHRHGDGADPAAARRERLPDDLLPPDDGARGRRRRSGSSTCSTPAGPIDRLLGGSSHSPCAAVVPRSRRGPSPALVLLGLWGIGNTMIIFLAALLTCPASCTRRPTSRARTPGSGSATSRCR